MLKLQSDWHFTSPGSIAIEVINEFNDLVHKVANQGQQWGMLEHFKAYFARAAGFTASTSSSESWAASDLHDHMMQAGKNAPLFIAAFYDACVAAQKDDPEISIPDVSVINRLLAKHSVGYELRPPHLLSLDPQQTIPVQEQPPSLDEQAQETIRQSLRQADLLLGRRSAKTSSSRESFGCSKRYPQRFTDALPTLEPFRGSILTRSLRIFASVIAERLSNRFSVG